MKKSKNAQKTTNNSNNSKEKKKKRPPRCVLTDAQQIVFLRLVGRKINFTNSKSLVGWWMSRLPFTSRDGSKIVLKCHKKSCRQSRPKKKSDVEHPSKEKEKEKKEKQKGKILKP